MLAERLATLEMRELNERQRADLAVMRYKQTKEALSHLEERNIELEERVSELSRKLLESQAKEGELSDRLAGEGSGTSFSLPSPCLPPFFLSVPFPYTLFSSVKLHYVLNRLPPSLLFLSPCHPSYLSSSLSHSLSLLPLGAC